MTAAAIYVGILVVWRLHVVCAKCDRAAFRWNWWKVKSSWGMLSFDLIACAVFFLLAKSAGTVIGTNLEPTQDLAIQLVISGVAATGVGGLTMPAALKRFRGAASEPASMVAPHVERETVNQYFERAIQQSCYSKSQLWIMEKAVPRVLSQRPISDFLYEAKHYLEGHDGPKASTDVKWIEKLMGSTETDGVKVASACGRLLARNGFSYLERVIAREPQTTAGTPQLDVPGPEAAVPEPRPDAPEPEAEMRLPGRRENTKPDQIRPPSEPRTSHGEARWPDEEVDER